MDQHIDSKHQYAGDLDRLLSMSNSSGSMPLYHDDHKSAHGANRIEQNLPRTDLDGGHSMGTPAQVLGSERLTENKAVHKFEQQFVDTIQMQPQLRYPLGQNDRHEAAVEYHLRRRAGPKRNYSGIASEDEQDNLEDGSGSDDEDEDQECLSDYQQTTSTTNQRSLPKPFNKKNLKRHRLSHSETRFLLNQFGQNPHPDATQRAMLAKQIHGLSARQIQVWFQNRRAKLKRMSAADADRMLSTRSYPDGYGPQGFGASTGITTCDTSNTYDQHLGEMFSAEGREFGDRTVYSRSASQLMSQQAAHTRASAMQQRHDISFEAYTARNQLASRAYAQYAAGLRNNFAMTDAMAAQPCNSPTNAAQMSSPSLYEQDVSRNLGLPSNVANLPASSHVHFMQSPYPRSIPMGEAHRMLSTTPGSCQIELVDSSQIPDQYRYHHPHGDISYNLGDVDMHEGSHMQQSQQVEPQSFQGSYFTPVHGSRTAETSMLPLPYQQYMTRTGFGRRRQASTDASLQADAHYYYGSDEHIKHEQNECQDALQSENDVHPNMIAHCSPEGSENADTLENALHADDQ